MKINFFLIIISFLFLCTYSVYAQKPSKKSLQEKRLVIENQVRKDLSKELENIEKLKIIGIPSCIMSKENNKIILTLDTIPLNDAVIYSGRKIIDHANNFDKEHLYTLRSTKKDTVIYIGRNDPPLVEKVLKYTNKPFEIRQPNYLFIGFAYYRMFKSSRYVSFSNSNPKIFFTVKGFLKYRLPDTAIKYLEKY